jgi:hypothetical protein
MSENRPAGLMPWNPDWRDNEPVNERRQRQWLMAFLLLGVVARVTRFALRFPLWYDEAALSASFLDRGYLDLFHPLECGQVAPIFFLWAQLTSVKLFGFNEYALRVAPMLLGLASLLIFRHLAMRLFRGTAAVVAFGVFAASYPAIRYAAEGKPYGADLFASLALVAIAVEWLRNPSDRRWLWALAAAIPLAVGLSFSAVFVAGAILVAVTWVLWRRSLRGGWWPWAVGGALLFGSFLASLAIAQHNVTAESTRGLNLYWKDAFPPTDSVGAVGRWFADVHTADIFSHPLGGKHGASVLTLLACATAVGLLIARRRLPLLIVFLGPFGLNLVAAVLHRYPYGGHVRLAMHLAPAVCLMAGIGFTQWLAWQRRAPWMCCRMTLGALGLLAIIPLGSAMRDVAHPYRTPNDERNRGFARWFWVCKAVDSELVCLKTDLGQRGPTGLCLEGDEATYLCNQRIYSPRHARGQSADMTRASASRPLCCVRFSTDLVAEDDAAFARWLSDMRARYDLMGQEEYPFPQWKNEEGPPLYTTRIRVYRFAPKRP